MGINKILNDLEILQEDNHNKQETSDAGFFSIQTT